MDLKLTDVEVEIVELASQSVLQAQNEATSRRAALIRFLSELAIKRGLNPDTHTYNAATHCFDPIPKPPKRQKGRK